jgi:hypothetical protein
MKRLRKMSLLSDEEPKRKKVQYDGEYINIKSPLGYEYEIPVSRMQTAAQVLDWIHQVCVAKTWGPSITKELLEVIFYEVIPSKMWSGKA